MAITLPNVWPIFNIINLINFDPAKPRDIVYNSFTQLLRKYFALTTYIFVAYISYKFSFPSYDSIIEVDNISNNTDYYKFFLKWFIIIAIRDQLIILFFYSSWHYILYDSKIISTKITNIKYNPIYPDNKQWKHDKLWTLNGTLISSIFEIFIIYYLTKNTNLLETDNMFCNKLLFKSLLWLLFIHYFRAFHFYFVHRLIHKWNTPYIDPGKYLYDYVHSLHHKSYNCGPWSGLSMHPIEHIIYYTCVLFPICCGIFYQHPIHILFNKMHCNLSPLPSHDGFDKPGGGDYFHYLHHAHFECNYGSSSIPMDYWFGTLEHGDKYKKSK